MNALRFHKRIDSETLHLPELKPLVGKVVEIIVLEETRESAQERDWQALLDVGGKDLIDPEIYKQYREFDRQHNVAPEL